jgi:hypothetical protein
MNTDQLELQVEELEASATEDELAAESVVARTTYGSHYLGCAQTGQTSDGWGVFIRGRPPGEREELVRV